MVGWHGKRQNDLVIHIFFLKYALKCLDIRHIFSYFTGICFWFCHLIDRECGLHDIDFRVCVETSFVVQWVVSFRKHFMHTWNACCIFHLLDAVSCMSPRFVYSAGFLTFFFFFLVCFISERVIQSLSMIVYFSLSSGNYVNFCFNSFEAMLLALPKVSSIINSWEIILFIIKLRLFYYSFALLSVMSELPSLWYSVMGAPAGSCNYD